MKPQRKNVPHLFKNWDALRPQIQRSSRIALFLDFDGTLVRIARRPELVHLENSTRHVLVRLARHKRVKVAIVSGRRRAELLHHIGLRNVRYLGLYGWESSKRTSIPYATRLALSRAHNASLIALSKYESVWIEPKQNTISVHLLGTTPQVQRSVRRKMHTLIQPLRSHLRLIENLRDIEVTPLVIRGKGAAVSETLLQPALRGAFPIYFGDDLSDEPGFAAVRGGLGVLVGKPRRTNARFQLRGPAQVTTALARLEAALR